jgi:hypothetical protein
MALASAMTRSGAALAIFAFATATPTGLLSSPSEHIPSNRAAKFVVPRPQKGSMTQSPRLPCLFSTRHGKMSGYIV